MEPTPALPPPPPHHRARRRHRHKRRRRHRQKRQLPRPATGIANHLPRQIPRQPRSSYVCRTAIGDSRLLSITDTHVSFRWKDRAHGDAPRIETIEGAEFVKRYLRHVLPCGLRAIRYYGYCHPAAKAKRKRIAFHTGRPLRIGALEKPPEKPPHVASCPCCGEPMKKLLRLLPAWRSSRAPPPQKRSCA